MRLELRPKILQIQTCTECNQQLPETGTRTHLTQKDIDGAAGHCPKCMQSLPKGLGK